MRSHLTLTLTLTLALTLTLLPHPSHPTPTPHHPRIVGGEKAERGEFKAQVGIAAGLNFNVFCGGTLIHPSWVLTAAHCVYDRKDSPGILRVWPGGYDRSAGSVSELAGVASVIVHSGYDDATAVADDIALLRLSFPVSISPSSPAGLAPLPPNPEGDPPLYARVTMSGWGATTNAGSGYPLVLRKVDSLVQPNSLCAANYARDGITILSSHLCAGEQCVTSRDSCYGDSGGPVWGVGSDGNPILVGITSFGGSATQPCGHPEYWSVNTRVSAYLAWIESHMGSDSPTYVAASSAYSTTRGGANAACPSGTPLTGSSSSYPVPPTVPTTTGGGSTSGSGSTTGTEINGDLTGNLPSGQLILSSPSSVTGDAAVSGSLAVLTSGVLTLDTHVLTVANHFAVQDGGGIVLLGSRTPALSVGSLSMGRTSSLSIKLGNELAQNAPVVSSGTATLSGTLTLIVPQGMGLGVGDVFEIVQFSSVSGEFDTIVLQQQQQQSRKVDAAVLRSRRVLQQAQRAESEVDGLDVRVILSSTSLAVSIVEASSGGGGSSSLRSSSSSSSSVSYALWGIGILCLFVVVGMATAAFVLKRRSDARHLRNLHTILPELERSTSADSCSVYSSCTVSGDGSGDSTSGGSGGGSDGGGDDDDDDDEEGTGSGNADVEAPAPASPSLSRGDSEPR